MNRAETEAGRRQMGAMPLKILFVGLAQSTHTQSWIDLVRDEGFDVRLFALPQGSPPDEWRVHTYLTTSRPPEGDDSRHRESLYPTPEEIQDQRRQRTYHLRRAVRKAVLRVDQRFGIFPPLVAGTHPVRAASPADWLAQIIMEWMPDVIHTFGLDPAGFFYLQVRERFDVKDIGQWVLQLRGGSDLALSHADPDAIPRIGAALRACDWLPERQSSEL